MDWGPPAFPSTVAGVLLKRQVLFLSVSVVRTAMVQAQDTEPTWGLALDPGTGITANTSL